MHVFLAGATGVLGRRIVPLLIQHGHRVTALTRSPERSASLLAAGATPVVADAFDAAALTLALDAAAPDVVMHQLTDLASGNSAANAVMRSEGSRNLVDAALRAGVRRVVAQSIGWAYAPGDEPADERTPLDLAAPEPRRASIVGVAALEAAVAELPEYVVLRYGVLYGRGTWYARDGLVADSARRGQLELVDDITSFVHVDDAAAAAVEALKWPVGTVNVCDDEPASGRDWIPAFCRAIGASPPALAGLPLRRLGWARGADNRHGRCQLRWVPRYASWRQGFRDAERLSRKGHRNAGSTLVVTRQREGRGT